MKLTSEEKRILELEAGLRDILSSKSVERMKIIAADLVGDDAEDYIDEEDYIEELYLNDTPFGDDYENDDR